MIPVLFWTDALIFLLILGLVVWLINFRKTEEWHLIWARIAKRPRYLVALMILMLYSLVGVLDSLHFKNNENAIKIRSVLDVLLSPRDSQTEITYSAPFALSAYNSEMHKTETGDLKQVYSKLQFSGSHLETTRKDKWVDIFIRIGQGLVIGLGLSLLFYSIIYLCFRKRKRFSFAGIHKTFWITLSCTICLLSIISQCMFEYHILGTDKIGQDVFYISVKSIRTGLVIGTVTTLVMLPFALALGLMAGYFRGWVDDLIQYLYTTLSSIPGILLIAAAMLSFQVRIEANPDLRLLILCIILGVTSWTTLCRLLRGEALKLREADFVKSAIVLGVNRLKIIRRHIMPNVMHIVIITVVLDFSGLVLAEAVLSYVGVGVDPTSFSWGNMINAARLDMARDPIVWWSLSGALSLMFILVFSANIFSDALREALDPRGN